MLCETIQNETLVCICKDILDALDWVGFADFDIMESKSGEYKVIEINPRVPASIHAAYIAGVNYPEMIVHDMKDEPILIILIISEKYYVFGDWMLCGLSFLPKDLVPIPLGSAF